jgi:inhibitor of KinA sporulation pathway (predicted exonuclease)
LHIAILAWSALVRDPGDLITLPFQLSGPSLALAFSRIAPDGRLELVLDEEAGMPSRTYVAPSAKPTLTEAIQHLAARENTTPDNIGFFDRTRAKRNDVSLQRHPRALAAIEAWAPAAGHNHVIWSALPSNFREKTRRVFSVAAAMDYLTSLDDGARKRALADIRNAPREVRSLLRNEIDRRWPGWAVR